MTRFRVQSGVVTRLAPAFCLAFFAACGASPLTTAPEVHPDASPRDESTRLDAGIAIAPSDAAPADAAPADAAPVVHADASGEPTPEDGGIAQPSADPRLAGPYGVGVRTLELTDPSRSRTFLVDVWYPIDGTAPCATPNTYELGDRVSLYSVETPACRDAPPLDLGPRPLVVFSHGFGGIRFQSYFIAEHLATHGIVTAAPDHPGNRLTDFAQLGSDDAATQSSIDRPLDVIFTLEHLEAGEPSLPAIDPTRIASSGHSFGGWTSLEVARRDPRFRVVVPMAPGFRNGSTPDMVAGLMRPILFIGGSVDSTCEFEENQRAPYQLADAPKGLLQVMGAGHLDFSNLCDIRIARLFIDDGCDPQSIDPAIVQDRVKAVATAFLLRYLRGEPGAAAYLDPTWVQALGQVQYEAIF